MKNIFKIFTILGLFAFAGCVDLEFDEPPIQSPETAIANTTIADLKALHISGDFETLDGDKIIEGIVIGDDETGNEYKGFIIQDATGGIEIRVNATNLYVDYPIGRKIYVKCNDLVMNDYNGLIQLGGSKVVDGNRESLAGIESTLIENFIIKGERDLDLSPTVKSINELTDDDIHTLIRLENVEFSNSDAGQVFANFQVNTNRAISDCNENEIVARTSGYASFASELTPTGNGSIVGIYTVFRTTKQFFIRSPEEVDMPGDRCSGGNGGGGGNTDSNTTISELKALHTLGAFETLDGGKIISGTIIGDDADGNLYKKIIIQDETGGITIGINAKNLDNKGLVIGTKIAIKCDGLDLGDDNNAIQIGSKYNSNGNDRIGGIDESAIGDVIVIGTSNNSVTPTVKTISSLTTADQQTLIQLTDVEFTSADAGESFADGTNQQTLNRTLLDCDNNEVVVRTSGFASFADDLTPSGNGQATGIYTVYGSTNQMLIRTPNEMSMTGTRCTGGGNGGGDTVFEEKFEGLEKYSLLDITDWVNIAEVGSDEERWFANDFEENGYAAISAYQSVDDDNTNWLITPSMDATSGKIFKFDAAQHHWATGGLSIWISNDFDGSDISAANWTEVSCTLPVESDKWYEWIPSGDILLQDYFTTDNVKIAFKYIGNKDSNATGFNIDNVILQEK